MMEKKRIQLIDGLRGLAVVMMVIHHFLFDLVEFLEAPGFLFSNPIVDSLHYIFASLFILLSGISSRFSRSNVKRGIRVLLVAFAISVVTYIIDMPIRFGVLHLLGFCMVVYGLTSKIYDYVPDVIMPLLCIVLLALSALVTKIPTDKTYLWMFGWTYPEFYSADYFPIFPWFFVFIFGTWVGKYIVAGKFPRWFYEKEIPFFPLIGRKALIIYIVHQPILYCITMGIKYLAGL